jgi:hypothetical protein
MPKGVQQKSTDELCVLFEAEVKSERSRFESAITADTVTELTKQVAADISAKLADPGDAWKLIIPGRPVVNSFASAANLNAARLKHMYIREAEHVTPYPFTDIIELFEGFSKSPQPHVTI